MELAGHAVFPRKKWHAGAAREQHEDPPENVKSVALPPRILRISDGKIPMTAKFFLAFSLVNLYN